LERVGTVVLLERVGTVVLLERVGTVVLLERVGKGWYCCVVEKVVWLAILCLVKSLIKLV